MKPRDRGNCVSSEESAGLVGDDDIQLTTDKFLSAALNTHCVRVQLPSENRRRPLRPERLARVLKKAGAGFASLRLPESAIESKAAATAAGFRPIETLITFSHDLGGPWLDVAAEIIYVENAAKNGDMAAQVAEIGRLAFHADRFHADPLVPNDMADRVKELWAYNNICGRAAYSALALSGSGTVSGFCEVVVRSGTSAIDLIAVHPTSQGRGLGRKMVAACLRRTADEHPNGQMLVGTSAANQVSINLYQSLGFVEACREVTLHMAMASL